MWRETDDLSEILAALRRGERVERQLATGGTWFPVANIDRYWAEVSLIGGANFRIEVPEPPAPSLPPGVVVVDTKKAQARHCPALVDAGWTVRSFLSTENVHSVVELAEHWPNDWFEVCPPEGDR